MKRLVTHWILAMVCLMIVSSTVYAGEITSTGFYYPLKDDTPNYSNCGKWLSRPSPNGCYPSSGVYHIGVDMAAGQNDSVYAIADGKILSVSSNGWSSGSTINVGIFIEHYLPNGQSFTALYGHIETSSAKKSGNVKAGDKIGEIGDWNGSGDHLHFAIITPELKYPVDGGKLGRWPDNEYGMLKGEYYDNGLIDPIWFITHNSPDNMLSRSGISVPNNITMASPWFSELCVKMYDSRCDGSSMTTWEECVLEGSSLCSDDPSKWSALSSGGYSSGNTENAGGDIGYETPVASLPNLHIEEFNIHDAQDHKLPDDGTGIMNVGQKYEIHVWPESLQENCMNGIEEGKDTVETDTFLKIGDDGDWEFLYRNYTQCVNMDEDDSKREIFDFIVPEVAYGKTIYFKSKVDATGEVYETDEGDNWCDTEAYQVPERCTVCPDFEITNVSLTGGRTQLNIGDHFGLRMVVSNLGLTPSPRPIRSAYYLLPPGATSWQYGSDDGTEAYQLCSGCSMEEWNKTDPFVANVAGIWRGMACADYLGVQSEDDETNNCTEFSFEVMLIPVRPDFVITRLGFREGLRFKNGTRVHPWAYVKNIGNASPSVATKIAYYIDGGYRDNDSIEIGEAMPGVEHFEEVLNNDIKLGDKGNRTLKVCADYQGSQIELSESNNCLSVPFVVY